MYVRIMNVTLFIMENVKHSPPSILERTVLGRERYEKK